MRDPSLEEVLESNFSYMLGGVNTAIPGVIVSIRDGLASSYVDVQPTINMVSEDSDPIPRPVVLNCPLMFPVSRSGGITFPVNVGDPVLLIYSMRGMDTWKRGDGGSTTPVDFRKMDGRDCIAIPGLHPMNMSMNNPSRRTNAHSTDDTTVTVGLGTPNETEVRLKPSGQVVVNAPGSVVVNTPNAEVNAPTIKLNGNVEITGVLLVRKLLSFLNGISGIPGTNSNTITGAWNINGDLYNNGKLVGSTHVHTNTQPGNGNSGPPA